MKTLILIRHAKSSWDDPSQSDFNRPLNKRGFENAHSMAERLRHRLSQIDGFYSSSALRAKTTAQKFAEAYQFPQQKIVFEQSLYLASAATLTSYIASIKEPCATIALFSHNPGITDFANSLYSGVRTDNIPTCGIFAVKAPIQSWAEFPASKKEFLFFDYPSLHR